MPVSMIRRNSISAKKKASNLMQSNMPEIKPTSCPPQYTRSAYLVPLMLYFFTMTKKVFTRIWVLNLFAYLLIKYFLQRQIDRITKCLIVAVCILFKDRFHGTLPLAGLGKPL